MTEDIRLIANRIKDLREIMEFTIEEMAETAGISAEEYAEYEKGTKDFSFSFLYTLAHKFGVDITDILTGEAAKLSVFSVVRAGEGVILNRRKEYIYEHLAFVFKNKKMEPFMVTVEPSDVDAATHKKSHDGQEMNFILEGSMSIFIGDQKIKLNKYDTIYFDAKTPHAMQAEDGAKCVFLAIIAD